MRNLVWYHQALIQRLKTLDLLQNMDHRRQSLRWFPAIIIFLISFVYMGVALTPDGLALLDFKQSLTTTSPLLQNWKASDVSPCSWGGIKCTAGGNVQNITLSSQVPMLKGHISSSLGRLKSLQALMLDHNLLSGSIPPELGNLSNLLTLSLSNNSLSGEIPPQLGRCTSLVELWLDGNALQGTIPESLSNLKNLSSLFLGLDRLRTETDAIANIHNFFTGPIAPMIYTNLDLKEFDVSYNNLIGNITTVLEELSKHPNIKWISMENNSFTGTLPPSIGNATTLLWLNLWGQIGGGFGGQIPKEIGKLKNLNKLNLAINNFTGEIPKDIGKLVKLSHVDLFSNNFIGEIPKEIEKLENLKFLTLASNNFTGEIPMIELSNLKMLTTLYLWGNNLNGKIPPEIGKLASLERLDLSFNKLNGTIPSSLGNLVNLEYLSLQSNNLTGLIPSSLGNLVNLKFFFLSYNNLTSPIPASFISLINLQQLHFHFSGLTGLFPTYISKMIALEEIDFWGNNMWGPIPEDFGMFMPNLTIFAMELNFFNGTFPSGLCQGGKLQRLGVGGNQLEGAIPPSLARCTSLVDVDLGNNQFTSIPDDFGCNSSLGLLGVAHNQLEGNLPKGLGVNSSLAALDMSDNRLTGDISILEFSQLAQNLSSLNLSRNSFSGEIPTTMAMCNLLYQVDLSYNYFTGAIPLTFVNLSRLEIFQLQGNNLTGLDPRMYSSWAITLLTLNLAQNPWNGPIASELGSLEVLQNLNLSYGGYTGSIPVDLGKLTQLEVLDISHNNLTGEIPLELGELMTSLVSVNISFNRLTGSLPPAWVKFLHAHPDSFRGNPSLCLEYTNDTNVCVSKTVAGKAKLSIGALVAIALGGTLAIVTIVTFLVWWLRPAPSTTNLVPRSETVLVTNLTSIPLPFSFEEIMAATENLSDSFIIGRGGHGVVYKVVPVSGGAPIVVKKIESLNMTTTLVHKSFWREVKTLGNTKHRNLVRLLGFMKLGKVGLLLYDYVSNGDLHSALYNREAREARGGDVIDLTWKARLHIAKGVANGLAYLHHDYNPPIVHRDIKSSNVLLDDDLEAHISDFGLAKVLLACGMQPQSEHASSSTSNVLGTHGYIAPEVGYGTPVAPAQDTYSFGVLLLELLTGRQPIDASYGEAGHIAAWVRESVLQNEGIMSTSVLDPSLLPPTNLVAKDEMLSVQRIALLCTRANPADRPTMRDVASLLNSLPQGNGNGNEIQEC